MSDLILDMPIKAYADLPRTKFPNQIDSRPGTNPDNQNTNLFENKDFALNINFSDRDAYTDSLNYYVMADDINALQDATIAIQRSLGVRPQGNTAEDVAERFINLEIYTRYHESMAASWPTTDHRYMWGSSNWPQISGNDVPLVSIVGHLHSGIAGQASKVHLQDHITNKLRKGNMDLESSTEHMLSAQDIRMSVSTQQTIAQHFETKYNKTGGIISGDVGITGRLTTRSFVEIDAFESQMEQGKGYAMSHRDLQSDSGLCRMIPAGSTNGVAMINNVALRFGDYSFGVRLKIPKQPSGANKVIVCTFKIRNNLDNRTEQEVVRVEDLTGDIYSMVHMKYNHYNTKDSLEGNKGVTFTVEVQSVEIPVSIDSLVISPLHIAVYDEDR